MGYMIRISPTRCIWLVHIVKNRVGIIRIKWGRCEYGFILGLKELLLLSISQTITNKKEKTNKQIKRKEKIKTKPVLRFT